MFRSVSASFSQKRDLKGIEVYRYTLEQNTLAAPTVNPDNQCYCRDQLASKNCSVAGALDISSCQDSQFPFVIICKWREGIPEHHLILPPCYLNRKTYLHLSAPLPSRQSHPAGECAGPESQRGAPYHLPGCGTCKKSFSLWDLWVTREEILMLFLFFYQITGFTLGFAKRIQVNMMYGPSNVVT